ncbi:MAG: branched-chain amino acid transaminase [Candidatus Zixiibacteriota bacterium]
MAINRYAYFKGKIVPIEKAKISIMTHAFNYGTAVFEGIRGFYNKRRRTIYLFRLNDHLLRMQNNCKILKIEFPFFSVDELGRLIAELIRKNGCREDIYIRPIAYKSRLGIGVKYSDQDSFAIFLQTVSLSDFNPLSVCISSWRRLEHNAIPPGAKISGSYVNSYLACLEARENGFDEAIMLTGTGKVSEGTGMNIFLVQDNKLATPPETANILKGITRDTIMVLAKEYLNIKVVERMIRRSELYSADELFFTGTGVGIAPIGKIDHRIIGNGRIGKITSKIKKLYARIARGGNKRFSEWRTPIQ